MSLWTKAAMPLAALGACLVAFVSGCANFIANQTEERSGSITVTFINNTRYRAAFTCGSYDPLDRDLPRGPVDLQQFRLEAGNIQDAVSFDCQRSFVIGTEGFIQRALDLQEDDQEGFDADAFDTVVHFSSAPLGSAAEALPTVGTAEGIETRLGVDYACNDELIFTFVEDATAPGGFRIEYHLLHHLFDT